MPVKVTTAPTSLRPRVSFAASAAASNGSGCRRTVALMSRTLSVIRRVGKGVVQALRPHHACKRNAVPTIFPYDPVHGGHGAGVVRFARAMHVMRAFAHPT